MTEEEEEKNAAVCTRADYDTYCNITAYTYINIVIFNLKRKQQQPNQLYDGESGLIVGGG